MLSWGSAELWWIALEANGSSLRSEEEEDVLEWARLLSVDGNRQLSTQVFNGAPRELVWTVPGTGNAH